MKPALSEIEAVLAVHRTGSFRAAALDLAMSTTALSNAVGKLERHLSVRLFNRTTRSVSLTDAGRLFIERVGPALSDIQCAIEAAQSLQEVPAGTLRINAFAAAAREVMSPLILAFARRYPRVHIDLVTEGRVVDIVERGFDMGIRPADLVPNDMIAIALGPNRRNAVVASPGYLERHGRPTRPTDLLDHACIRVRLPSNALYRWQFARDGEALHVDVKGPMTLDESSLARLAVLEGIGIGFFMEADVRADIAAGRLVRLLEDWMPPVAPLSLYYPGRKNPSAAFAAFIDAARAYGAARPETLAPPVAVDARTTSTPA